MGATDCYDSRAAGVAGTRGWVGEHVGEHVAANLPGVARFAVHDEAARQPHLENVVSCELLGRASRLKREQSGLCLFVLARRSARDGVVVEEGGVVGVVRLTAVPRVWDRTA